MPAQWTGWGVSRSACISSVDRCRTRRESAFFIGITRIRWICSNADGTRYSMKRMNDLIAASRTFLELGRRRFQPLARVVQQHLEGIGVGVTGIDAGVALKCEALLEEGTNVRCYGGHDMPPVRYASARSAMLHIRAGTASRYQYVSATLQCPR